MKKTTLQKASEDVVKLLELYPITLSEPKAITIAQGEALGRMFGDNAYREAIETFIRTQNKNLIAATTEHQHIYFKARIDTLMQLLILGKTHFINFEMLRGKKSLTGKERFDELQKHFGQGPSHEADLTRDEINSGGTSTSGAHAETTTESPTEFPQPRTVQE